MRMLERVHTQMQKLADRFWHSQTFQRSTQRETGGKKSLRVKIEGAGASRQSVEIEKVHMKIERNPLESILARIGILCVPSTQSPSQRITIWAPEQEVNVSQRAYPRIGSIDGLKQTSAFQQNCRKLMLPQSSGQGRERHLIATLLKKMGPGQLSCLAS